MRQHRSTSVFVAVVFLMGLAVYIADSARSAPDIAAPSLIAQAEEGKDQPPAGDVQERAVPRLAPDMQPGRLLTPAPAAAPPPLSIPAEAAPAPAGPVVVPIDPGARHPKQSVPQPQALPGMFTIRTGLKNTYLFAEVTGAASDAFSTVATQVSPPAKFRLYWIGPQAPQYKFIETAYTGYTVMAPDGGGHADSSAIMADLKGLPYGQYIPLSQFRFVMNRIGNTSGWGIGESTIQTSNGNFVTAVGGGGHTTNALHTDARTANTWEYFYINKCGELGSGLTYGIKAPLHGFLKATGGGGQTHQAITANETGISDLARFTLIQQADGSFALRTPNGINYVTAVGGGGHASGDNLHTDATQVQAWEKFRIIDGGVCTYTIQTVSGHFLGIQPDSQLSTNMRIEDAGAHLTLFMFDL